MEGSRDSHTCRLMAARTMFVPINLQNSAANSGFIQPGLGVREEVALSIVVYIIKGKTMHTSTDKRDYILVCEQGYGRPAKLLCSSCASISPTNLRLGTVGLNPNLVYALRGRLSPISGEIGRAYIAIIAAHLDCKQQSTPSI